MKYTIRANNTWHEDIEIWEGNDDNPVTGLSVFEPEETSVFTGLLDENGDYIYRDISYRIGFKVNREEE